MINFFLSKLWIKKKADRVRCFFFFQKAAIEKKAAPAAGFVQKHVSKPVTTSSIRGSGGGAPGKILGFPT